MPYLPIPMPLYPQVPFALGVPMLLRAPGVVWPPGEVALAMFDHPGALASFSGPQWGIFTTDGEPVAIPDTVVSMDFRREWRVSDYPIEEGGFQSYDKVQLPFDARVRMAVSNSIALGGPNSNRADFLLAVDTAAKSMDLYSVMTPDAIYDSVTINHYDYRRDIRAGGPGMLVVDLWLEQVRVTAAASVGKSSTENAQQPTSQPPKNGGTKQPQGFGAAIAAQGIPIESRGPGLG